MFFIPVTAPQGATVAYTDAETRKVEQIVDPLRSSGEAARIFAIVGRSNEPHQAFVVVRLADWGERARPQQDIVRSLIPELGQISGARAFPVNPAGLGLRGSRTPLQVVIGGPDYESVTEWSTRILRRAEGNPGLLNLETDFEQNQPQLDVRIDRAKADDLDIGVENIAETLQTMLASREITTYVDRGREYPVIVQAQAEDRRTPTDLANIFVRCGASGELTPLTALVTLGRGRGRAVAAALRPAALGHDLGLARRGLRSRQRDPLHAGGRRRDPAARGQARLRRPVAAVPRDLGRGRGDLRAGAPDRVPGAGRAVRELPASARSSCSRCRSRSAAPCSRSG